MPPLALSPLSSSVSALPRIILSVLDVFDRLTLSCVYLFPIVHIYLAHPLHRPTSSSVRVSARSSVQNRVLVGTRACQRRLVARTHTA